MESIDADLDCAVKAVLSRKDALRVRDAAYARLVIGKGWSTLKVEREMREQLLAEGLTEAELSRQGISHDSVRQAVVNVRPDR